jgi:hypothetical protein
VKRPGSLGGAGPFFVGNCDHRSHVSRFDEWPLPSRDLVDGIDDPVGGTYSGMPSRLYLIDTAGKVAYKSGRGPFGFKPSELEHSLLLMLAEQSKGAE